MKRKKKQCREKMNEIDKILNQYRKNCLTITQTSSLPDKMNEKQLKNNKQAKRALYGAITNNVRWPHRIMPEYWHRGVDSCINALARIMGIVGIRKRRQGKV